MPLGDLPAHPSGGKRLSDHSPQIIGLRYVVLSPWHGSPFDSFIRYLFALQPRSGGGMVAYRNCLAVYGGRCRRDGRVSFSDRVEVFSFGG